MKVQIMPTRIRKTNKKFQPENNILASSKACRGNYLTVALRIAPPSTFLQVRKINRDKNKIDKSKN